MLRGLWGKRSRCPGPAPLEADGSRKVWETGKRAVTREATPEEDCPLGVRLVREARRERDLRVTLGRRKSREPERRQEDCRGPVLLDKELLSSETGLRGRNTARRAGCDGGKEAISGCTAGAAWRILTGGEELSKEAAEGEASAAASIGSQASEEEGSIWRVEEGE